MAALRANDNQTFPHTQSKWKKFFPRTVRGLAPQWGKMNSENNSKFHTYSFSLYMISLSS